MASSIGLNFFHIRTRLINRFKLAFQEIEQDIIGDYFQCNLPDELFKFIKEKATLSIKLFDQNGVTDYLASHFDILHTQGSQWLMQEIDDYIKNKQL